MSVNVTTPSVHGLPDLADPVIVYAEWRTACMAVWTAYRDWTNASKGDRLLAHAAYAAALDREDAAASAYSRVVLRTLGPADGLVDPDATRGNRPAEFC